MVAIRAITTGGSMDKTYCGKASDFIVGAPTLLQILKTANVVDNHTVTIQEICRKDSLDLNSNDREQIRNAIEHCSETKILITHGTDTMWKTAAYVQETAIKLNKTVVCMGAMQPAAFVHSDATFNVGFAISALLLLPPGGAHVTMNGEIFSNPLRIYKDFDRNIFYEGDADRDLNE